MAPRDPSASVSASRARARVNAPCVPESYELPAFRLLPSSERAAAETLARGASAADAARRSGLPEPLVVSLSTVPGFAQAVDEVREAREDWILHEAIAATVELRSVALPAVDAIARFAQGEFPMRPKRIDGRVQNVPDMRGARLQFDACVFILSAVGLVEGPAMHSPGRAISRRLGTEEPPTRVPAETLAKAQAILRSDGAGSARLARQPPRDSGSALDPFAIPDAFGA